MTQKLSREVAMSDTAAFIDSAGELISQGKTDALERPWRRQCHTLLTMSRRRVADQDWLTVFYECFRVLGIVQMPTLPLNHEHSGTAARGCVVAVPQPQLISGCRHQRLQQTQSLIISSWSVSEARYPTSSSGGGKKILTARVVMLGGWSSQ